MSLRRVSRPYLPSAVRRLATTASAVAVSLGLGAAALSVPAHAAAPAMCAGTWTKSTVVSGVGALENLGFDGQGGLVLSESNALNPKAGRLLRALPDGSVTPLRSKVFAPGAIVAEGETIVHTVGDAFASGWNGTADGGLERVNVSTGEVTTLAKGLVMPNGLASLGAGRYVVSRDLGTWTGLTLVAPEGNTALGLVGSPNGLAYDAASSTLYVTTTFTAMTSVYAVRVGETAAAFSVKQRWSWPGFGLNHLADDLTIGADGNLYIAHNLGGKIVRLDPRNGEQCIVAQGLTLPSSVRFGAGAGWDPASLYVTSFAGKVFKFTPN